MDSAIIRLLESGTAGASVDHGGAPQIMARFPRNAFAQGIALKACIGYSAHAHCRPTGFSKGVLSSVAGGIIAKLIAGKQLIPDLIEAFVALEIEPPWKTAVREIKRPIQSGFERHATCWPSANYMQTRLAVFS